MARLRAKLITIPWELEVPTLALACLAAVTPPEVEVCVVDVLRERLLLDEPVDLVGITASTPRIKAAYALADFYRGRGVKVVLGGHHATAMPEEALEHADAVVCGEGETSWRRICEQMLERPDDVHGVYRDPPPDLAALPLPRTDLAKIERYQPFYYPVMASRGCPEACSFCFAKRMTCGYRTYPIGHVLEQVRRRPSWVKALYFVDDNLAGDLDYTRELLRELAKYGVPFGAQVRHEFSRDPADLRLAREAGCVLLSSGYESVNQRSLDRTGKNATATDYAALIAAIQREGIIASGNWMFGFDWDTPDIFEATWDFLRASGIWHCSFTTEIPFPGTPSYKRYLREGRLLTTDYDDFVGKDKVVVRPKQMTPDELRRGIRQLTLRYYSVRHRHRLYREAAKNPRFLPHFQGWTRRPVIWFLNHFQVFLYTYRMVPALRWLYDRLAPLNRHRHVRDLFRGTNFWRSTFEPAVVSAPPITTTSPFLWRAGEMRPGERRLVPVGAEAGPGA
ncbi:MAG: B12-binding domain-containing radical SAM protein [Planctomycetes bacterium]|nr:B12-binding domain-containing radical SAM protein [Planctomycetota bacterium]